uniref:Uncharacterized protein n=1 Tax=Anguilla anguilla TaxID=7936 RepID=A0A0E9TNR8_ANGAN
MGKSWFVRLLPAKSIFSFSWLTIDIQRIFGKKISVEWSVLNRETTFL